MRKTRKKAALVLLALLTAAQLNGCGGKETTETTAEGTASVQTTAHGDETGSGMETSAADGGAGTAGQRRILEVRRRSDHPFSDARRIILIGTAYRTGAGDHDISVF